PSRPAIDAERVSTRNDVQAAGAAADLDGVAGGVAVDRPGGEAGAAADRVEALVVEAEAGDPAADREGDAGVGRAPEREVADAAAGHTGRHGQPHPGLAGVWNGEAAELVVGVAVGRGTAAQIAVRGGASNLVFDAQRLGAVGGPTRLSTPGWDAAPDRWSIE